MRSVIYIAGPYSAKTIDKRNANIEAADEAGRACFAKGWMPIVPHSITASWELDDRFPANTDWVAADFSLLQHCQAVCVVGKDWQKSMGTCREIDFATENGLPVWFGTENVPLAEEFICDITSSLVQRYYARRRKGVAEYGTALFPFTGNNARQDKAEELMDYQLYHLQEEIERAMLENMRLVRRDEP